ncbi:MAG: morphogenetic protein [Planctomycetota bacterium]|jgi:hypothetical protein
MKERPILFNAEMVRAILDGRKTQTRRPMKLRDFRPSDTRGYEWAYRDNRALWNEVSTPMLIELKSPFGQPGDRLWVRETWAKEESRYICPNYGNPGAHFEGDLFYRASHDDNWPGPWKPSIHMPRAYSRITLEAKRVWAERLRSITPQDCHAEGIRIATTLDDFPAQAPAYTRSFNDIWAPIYAAKGYGWDENPWVWACEFEVVR